MTHRAIFSDNSCTHVMHQLISFIRNVCLKEENGGVVGAVVSWHTAYVEVCFYSISKRFLSPPHTHAKCFIYWESKMVKSDILIIFQTFINVCNWLLPSYTSRRNGCVHANTHANSHHRYIHSSFYFQMSPSKTQN